MMPLSPREEQVLRRSMRGEPLKAIAVDLGVAESTTQAQNKSALRKLGGPIKAREYAEREGWFDPPGLADVMAASDRLASARRWCRQAERELREACARLATARVR